MKTPTPPAGATARFARPPQLSTVRDTPLRSGLAALAAEPSLGAALRAECRDLAREPDLMTMAREALGLAQRLKRNHQEETAARLLALLTETNQVPAVAAAARQEWDALLGTGPAGLRAEYLVGRLGDELSDYRSFLPMLGAGLVGELAGAATFARLSASGRSVATAGRLARSSGFLAETAAFAGLQRALSEHPRPWPGELASAALNLGALKGFGRLAQGASERVLRSAAGRAAPAALFLSLQQALLLAGIFSARRAEEFFGLRPSLPNATLLTDALAASLGLQIGGRLAAGLLPGGLTRDLSEWRRAELFAFRQLASRLKANPSAAALGPLLLGLTGCAQEGLGRGGHAWLGAGGLALAGLSLYGIYRATRPPQPRLGEYYYRPSPSERWLLREFFLFGRVPELITWPVWQKIQRRVLIQARILPPRRIEKIPLSWRSKELQLLALKILSEKELHDLRMDGWVMRDPFPSKKD
ncbi:MAG: hypothetical protein U1F66_09310 [bacterium]